MDASEEGPLLPNPPGRSTSGPIKLTSKDHTKPIKESPIKEESKCLDELSEDAPDDNSRHLHTPNFDQQVKAATEIDLLKNVDVEKFK